jgi:hypothetical protein
MKNIVILSSLIAAFIALSACSSCNSPCAKEAAPCPAHHDLKGECGDK